MGPGTGAQHLPQRAALRRAVCVSCKITEKAELSVAAASLRENGHKPAEHVTSMPASALHEVAGSLSEPSSRHEPPATPVPELSWTVSGQTVTPIGLWMAISVFFTAIVVQIPILAAWLYSEAFDDPPETGTRRGIDWIIGFWAFASMSLCGYRPRVEGAENLPDGACVYAPNHSSFLDILTLTGFVPRPFKYVSKASILQIPFIGWPMQLAEHIPLQQSSRRSQLETFKLSVESLESGNSIVAFPEGGRSDDGALQPFKRGPFKMALRAGVPVVPVTISDVARWYPKGTLLPIGVPTDVVLTIHPPIETKGMRDETEVLQKTYELVNSALPLHQKGPPLEELALD